MDFKQKITKLMQADKYADAFLFCGKALRENPFDIEVLEKTTFIFQRIQDAHIDLAPATAEEYTLRGIAYFYSRQYDLCIADCTNAIKLDDNYDYAWKCRHLAHLYTSNLTLAESDIRKAIDIRPTAEYYNDLGTVISGRPGINMESLDCHLKATQLEPNHSLYWYNYGVDLAEKGYVSEAIRMFDKAIELFPNYDDAIHNRNHYAALLNNQNN